MNAASSFGPSLGDILGAALSGQRETRLAAGAQYLSALALADQLSTLARRPQGEVFDALTYVPDNMLSLLTSPQGWSALAQYVAADLGLPALDYTPTVH